MNELKTLKDIREKHGIFGPNYVCEKTLKQEVIKWVKEYSNEKISTPVTYKQVMKQVFSEFFNITEEDLK